MLWECSWMRPYTDTPADGGPRFWQFGVRLSGYDAMMSWLRLLIPADCIPLSHYKYIMCLNTLRCCGKNHGCGLTLIRWLTVGPDFGNLGGVRLSGYDAMMSWLRLLSPADCIPLSHYIYIKSFSTLRFCGKTHGCGLTLILRLMQS